MTISKEATIDHDDEGMITFRARVRRYAHAPLSPPSPQKRGKASRGYSSPKTYAHLPQTIPDYLGEDLHVLFVGDNPGIASVTAGHHYANPTNVFWPYLRASGLVDEETTFRDDHTLPDRFRLGLTNIVGRPSRSTSELSKDDFAGGVPILREKIERYRPRIVCFVGMGIYKHFFSVKCTKLGAQERASPADPIYFVMPSTSGIAAAYPRTKKMEMFRELKALVDTFLEK